MNEKLKKLLQEELKKSYREENTSILKLSVYKAALLLKNVVYSIQHRKYIISTKKELNNLKNKNRKNVFVFANGPSVSDIDFIKIKNLVEDENWDLITINSFASKAIEQFNIIPTISIFADPYHYVGNGNGELTEQAELDIKAINEKNIPAFVPYHLFSKSKFNRSIPFCSATNVYSKNVSDISKPLGYYPVTAFYAISLALNIGYENIFICGYDNSYFKNFELDEKNTKFFLDKHFYDPEKIEKIEIKCDGINKTSDVFLNFYRHFKFLEKINENKRKFSSIKNIAKTTYTDAFERDLSLDIYKS